MQYVTRILILCFVACTLSSISQAQAPPYAADLTTPIGLEMDAQGWLWVAEIGTGATDGRISIVTPDRQVHTFIEGLGSVYR